VSPKPNCLFRRLLLVTAALSATLWFMVVPTLAQDENQISALVEQLQQLRDEFNELQRVFYGGEAPRPAADIAEVAAAAADVAGRVQAEQVAQFEIRLSALDKEIRNLTGTLELIGFGVKQNLQSIERIGQDLEFRLQAIEHALSAVAPAAGGEPDSPAKAAAMQAVPPVFNPSPAAGPVAVMPGGDPGAAGAQVLGVLPVNGPNERGIQVAPEVPAEPEPTPEEQYKLAYGLLLCCTGEAELAFLTFLEANPEHDLVPNARYWLGETYYTRKLYSQAAQTFFEAYNAAPDGDKAADNFLKLGMSLASMSEIQPACAVLTDLPKRFPATSERIRNQAAAERTRLECP